MEYGFLQFDKIIILSYDKIEKLVRKTTQKILTERVVMPEISRFLGIVIKMFFSDHAPPHFHAFYGDFEACFCINTLELISGTLPS